MFSAIPAAGSFRKSSVVSESEVAFCALWAMTELQRVPGAVSSSSEVGNLFAACACSGLLMYLVFAQCKVLDEHQGLFSLPEPITEQRSLPLNLSLLQKIQVLFLLICSVFPGLFQHYPEAVLELFNTP